MTPDRAAEVLEVTLGTPYGVLPSPVERRRAVEIALEARR